MNIDTGQIKHWADLTPEERESGRWVPMPDGVHARDAGEQRPILVLDQEERMKLIVGDCTPGRLTPAEKIALRVRLRRVARPNAQQQKAADYAAEAREERRLSQPWRTR